MPPVPPAFSKLRALTWAAILVLVPGAFAFACSSGTSGGACGTTTCQGPVVSGSSSGMISMGSDACGTCLEANCSAQVSATCSDCASIFACEAKCQCSDNTCLTNCLSTGNAACTAATQAVLSCSQSSCASACNFFPGSSSSSSSTSSGSAGGNCQALSACCAMLTDATQQSECNQVVTEGNDSGCASTLMVFQNASQCSG
jgi:hypothetical protein